MQDSQSDFSYKMTEKMHADYAPSRKDHFGNGHSAAFMALETEKEGGRRKEGGVKREE